jgi:sulfite reductase (NADPH) flavoprotein alpha-component
MTHAALLLLSFFAVLLFIHVLLLAWLLYARRAEKKQTRRLDSQQYLIIYASQSGQAEQYAQHTAQQLRQAGAGAKCVNIQDIRAEELPQACKVLWMVSTYGEGDAPDQAQAFQQKILRQSFDLSQMSYAVLAFGDRRYANFCHFGQELNAWLLKQQAQPWFDLVCVDQSSAADLNTWTHHLEKAAELQLGMAHEGKQWTDFRLKDRQLLNAGSCGGAMYRIMLSVHNQQWQSGDILEVQSANGAAEIQRFLERHPADSDQAAADALKLKNLRQLPLRQPDESFSQWVTRFAPLPLRDYSIASIPESKQLELVVRQQITEQGLGVGSGWLTESAAFGESITAHIRTNPAFHLAKIDKPMIFIGNGSGIAGLMAHLQQRHAWGFRQNWLIFGERQQQFDFLFEQPLSDWKNSGVLHTLDTVFSRDHQPKKYVQHALAEKAEQLCEWVNQGAYIYLCGSLQGMAQGVDEALTEILGAAHLEQLRREQRYRRDVY